MSSYGRPALGEGRLPDVCGFQDFDRSPAKKSPRVKFRQLASRLKGHRRRAGVRYSAPRPPCKYCSIASSGRLSFPVWSSSSKVEPPTAARSETIALSVIICSTGSSGMPRRSSQPRAAPNSRAAAGKNGSGPRLLCGCVPAGAHALGDRRRHMCEHGRGGNRACGWALHLRARCTLCGRRTWASGRHRRRGCWASGWCCRGSGSIVAPERPLALELAPSGPSQSQQGLDVESSSTAGERWRPL